MNRESIKAARLSDSLAVSWRVSCFIALCTLLLTAATQPRAHAITINMEYTDEGDPVPHDENPSWDPAGVILKQHFQAAEGIWEALLPGGGDYEFDFHWDDDIGANTQGLTTEAGVDSFIEINPNFNWFADPTPNESSEFSFTQSLFSGLPAFSQTTYFPGTAPPGPLEVGYVGTGMPGQVDLMTVVLHEMGHILGISMTEPGEYNIDPQHIGGLTNVLVLEDNDSPHLAGDGAVPFLMQQSLPAGVRRLPSATEVLVIAEDQSITDVSLARVGRISSGVWSDGAAWIGGDQPSIPQDAYITHGGSVTLDVPAWVGKLLVAPGNSLQVQSQNLRVEGDFMFAGAAVSVGSGGAVLAGNIVGDTSALTTVAGSSVGFNSFTPGPGSTATSANFNGSVAIGYNTGIVSLVTFDPDALATWTIAEQLSIGALLTRTVLVIDNGADFTSGSGLVGNQPGQGHVTINGLGSTWTINGPLTANYGSITVANAGQLTSGDAVLGNDIGAMDVTVDYSFWTVNGDLTVGPATPGGNRRGRVVVREAGQVLVDGDLEIRGATDTVNSEVIVEEQGLMDVDGVIGVRMFGALKYLDDTHANGQTIDNYGNTAGGETGGRTIFANTASASNATIRNHGAGAFVFFGAAPAGATHFLDNSDAGTANITNRADGVSTVVNGQTVFFGSSNASFATIENEGSATQSSNPGRTEFRNNSRAADATIHNRGFLTVGGLAGRTFFYDSATAENADINLYGGYSDDGRLEFHQSSTAANATIIAHNIPTIVGRANNGGIVFFYDNSTAAQSQITFRQNGAASSLQFLNNTRAGDAQITTEDDSGGIIFWGTSTAGDPATAPTPEKANISLGRGSVMTFYDQSKAEDADITLAHGAQVRFDMSSSAGQANIVAAGSNLYPWAGGTILFTSTSTANNSTITLHGATVSPATGASAAFINGSHAGNATITAHGGSGGGGGAMISFNAGAQGDTARLIANAGASIDFLSQRFYGDGSTTVGSIEGAGTVFLRGSHLITGTRNLSTTVSGPITDAGVAGGRLTKVGTGALTLAGANTYSGLTTVNAGMVSITGSIAGGAVINAGGTLGGTGTVGGTVTVNSGGVFAPGTSAGTITVRGLTLSSGSALNFELGDPLRDHIMLTNNGNVSLAGALNVSLLPGYTPTAGQIFPLFEGSVGAVTGAFASFIPPVFNDLMIDLRQVAGSLALQVVGATLPGDFNDDGTVDARDYVVWRKGLGNPYTNTHYNIWRAHFGQPGTGSGSGATGYASASADSLSAAIPEPSSLVLLMLALTPALMIARHNRAAKWITSNTDRRSSTLID